MIVCRGLLTGKYKRDQKLDASLGRIGAVAENEKQALQSAPAWSKFNNDFYWKLRDGLEQIGKDHGTRLYTYMYIYYVLFNSEMF